MQVLPNVHANKLLGTVCTNMVAGVAVTVSMAAATLWSERAYSVEENTTWRALALHRSGESYEKWQWLNEALQEKTDGRLSLEVVTAEELGLSGTEFLRVLETGMVDVAEITTGYVTGDYPMIEAPELPGITSSYENAQEVTDAWMQEVIIPNEERMGGKVLASFAWSPIYLYTSFPIDSLDDLEGKKIRVFSTGQAKYFEALGAAPMSLPITELYGALQRGLLDGVATGTEHIKGMKLWELTGHISDVGLAPSTGFIVISEQSWNALPEELQQALAELGPELTDVGWELGAANREIGFAAAREHGMNLDNVSMPEAWRDELEKVASEVVLPWWFSRTGDKGKQQFNEVLAPLTTQSTN